jgi:hypothetical protein
MQDEADYLEAGLALAARRYDDTDECVKGALGGRMRG